VRDPEYYQNTTAKIAESSDVLICSDCDGEIESLFGPNSTQDVWALDTTRYQSQRIIVNCIILKWTHRQQNTIIQLTITSRPYMDSINARTAMSCAIWKKMTLVPPEPRV